MKTPSQRRLILATFHRWTGIAATLFLVSLSLSGLALNHAVYLKLDQIFLNHRFILSHYRIEPRENLRAWKIHGSEILTWYNGWLHYNGSALASARPPIGIQNGDRLTAIISPEAIVLIDGEGNLVERLGHDTLPLEEIQGHGLSKEGEVVLETETGLWQVDQEWTEFRPYKGEWNPVDSEESATVPPEQLARIRDVSGARGISLHRLLLDLHSGRFFGTGGRTIMDMAAVAILFLAASGLFMFLGRRR